MTQDYSMAGVERIELPLAGSEPAALPLCYTPIGGPGANRTLIAKDTWFTARLKDHLHPTRDGVAVRSRASYPSFAGKEPQSLGGNIGRSAGSRTLANCFGDSHASVTPHS